MKLKHKFSKDISSVLIVTFYLILYCVFLQYEKTKIIGVVMLGLAPFLVVWMVYTVLKHGKYDGPELGNEEYGYRDKNKNDLGMF